MESGQDGLDVIAQVIAECYACDWNSRQLNISIPIYGILCDGSSFQFFAFDGNTKPYKFSRGVVPGSHLHTSGLPLVDFSSEPTARAFIRSLRPICETVFNLLLVAYIAGLKMFRDRSTSRRQNLDSGWDKALKFAEDALEKSQDAEAMRKCNLIVDADTTAETAFKTLKLRCNTDCQAIYPSTSDGWLE